MEAISPSKYREYVSVGKNRINILYVQLKKALYDCIHSALILYRKLKGKLEDFGFLINPYDACIDNKWVNGTHITVTRHINDPKISHKEAGDVTKIITYLEYIYGPMTVKRGKRHTYLGIEMDFTERGTLKVSMAG